MCRGPGG